jgi:hypothetical protein
VRRFFAAIAPVALLALMGSCRTDSKTKTSCALASVLLRYPSYVAMSCKAASGQLRCMVDSSPADIPEALKCEAAVFVPLAKSSPSDPCVALSLGRNPDPEEWVVLLHTATWRTADGGTGGGGMLMRQTGGRRNSLSTLDTDWSPAALADDDYVRHVLANAAKHCGQ